MSAMKRKKQRKQRLKKWLEKRISGQQPGPHDATFAVAENKVADAIHPPPCLPGEVEFVDAVTGLKMCKRISG